MLGVCYLALEADNERFAAAYNRGATIVFGAGRVASYLGYPCDAGIHGFGITTTKLPTIAGDAWSARLISR